MSDPEDNDHSHMKKLKKAGNDKINQYHGNVPAQERGLEDEDQPHSKTDDPNSLAAKKRAKSGKLNPLYDFREYKKFDDAMKKL